MPQFHSRLPQEPIQSWRGKLLREGHGRNVPAQIERVFRRDGTDELPVKVLRIVAAERRAPVTQQGARLNEPLLKRQSIDERLERRSRRAMCANAIHLAMNVRVQK